MMEYLICSCGINFLPIEYMILIVFLAIHNIYPDLVNGAYIFLMINIDY